MLTILEFFPKICQLFPRFSSAIMHLGMSLIFYYHTFSSNTLINTAFENGTLLERVANTFLLPVHYLCEGKSIQFDSTQEQYHIEPRFHYRHHPLLYSPIAITFFPPGLIIGSVLKTIAFISPEVKERHASLKKQLISLKIASHNSYYRTLGMEINDFKKGELLSPRGYSRRPGDENNLKADKEALKVIAILLYENEIPFWIDCGTLLGAYRYGGSIPWDNDLDIDILVNDFQNVMNILRRLDPKKYVVQDWSNRNYPGTYIRVYIHENHNHIDIYTTKIDPQQKTIATIFSYTDCSLMAESWKNQERKYTKPLPFSTIFPLKKALFDGIEVPVPNRTEKYLRSKYGSDLSPSYIYNEKTRQYEKLLSHPYWKKQ